MNTRYSRAVAPIIAIILDTLSHRTPIVFSVNKEKEQTSIFLNKMKFT